MFVNVSPFLGHLKYLSKDEENGKIHPLEIKKSANPDKRDIRKFGIIDKTSLEHSAGGIICMFPYPFPIDDANSLIPSNLI